MPSEVQLQDTYDSSVLDSSYIPEEQDLSNADVDDWYDSSIDYPPSDLQQYITAKEIELTDSNKKTTNRLTPKVNILSVYYETDTMIDSSGNTVDDPDGWHRESFFDKYLEDQDQIQNSIGDVQSYLVTKIESMDSSVVDEVSDLKQRITSLEEQMQNIVHFINIDSSKG